jgi:hypothetical protein
LGRKNENSLTFGANEEFERLATSDL